MDTPLLRGQRRRLLQRPEDLHCVLFHLFCLGAYGVAFWWWLHPEEARLHTLGAKVTFVVGASLLLGWISGVDVGVNFHNHTHRRIFVSPAWNRWATRLWTVSGGWPGYLWQYSHVTVHHAHLLQARDWTLPRRNRDGRFENIYVYLLCHWPWRYAAALWSDLRTGLLDRRRAAVESAWFLLLWSIPFWIDPWMGLWLWALPHWVANCITMGSGMYVQHAGCVPKSALVPLGHSNSYLSPFFNVTMFNIGYHIEHHDHPGVHWADLPAFHARQRQAMVVSGAHFLPYGYYGAAARLSTLWAPARALKRFSAEHALGHELPAAGKRAASA